MVDIVSNVDFKVMFLNDRPMMQLPPRLTILEAVDFKTSFQQLLHQGNVPEQIVFDCSQTMFIDSSGIGALVSNHKIAQEKGVDLVFRNIPTQMMAVLVMTGLDQVLKIEQSSESITKANTWLDDHLPTTHPSVRSKVKRVLDILGSIVGLLLTAIAFIPIAIVVKLDSPGPIFFVQTRLGWMGRPFRIWKFRSMYADAEARKQELETKNESDGKTFKIDKDPRITRVGRFLRKTSLDELPQFWNVLNGEMSLVGTRPPTPNEVEIYEVPEWRRLDVKPGMTGEWQVKGRDKILNFEDIIKLDLEYQHNWSLTHDLKLIIQTISVVLRRTGK